MRVKIIQIRNALIILLVIVCSVMEVQLAKNVIKLLIMFI